MTYKEALDYIHSVERFGSRPGLSRITELLEKLGEPHKGMKFVHIAGTNGKGSCAAMCASVLKTSGYKTGLYTSPYIFRFNERMQINGKQIEDEELVGVVEQVKSAAETMEDHPTEFELMTAAAMLWYKQEKCDIVVLEVGLGGRFDATNIIDAPEVAVIMNIGLDHVTVLGDTVEQIAFEKAGIIKPGCDVVLYQQDEGVCDVIRRRCEEENAALHIVDFAAIKPEFDSLMGQSFKYKEEIYALPLLGSHQLKNAAVVLETVEVLRERGWKLDQSDVEHGIYAVSWPGRFELINDEPEFIVDGGHNPQCAQTVKENLLHYFPGVHRVLLVGVLKDKDFESLADILDEAADEYVCISPNNPRALPVEDLAASLEKFGKKVSICDSIEDGVETAMDRAASANGMVCAVGSLYSVGDIRAYFGMY